MQYLKFILASSGAVSNHGEAVRVKPMIPIRGDSNPCLRVVRLSGDLLQVPLTRHEANKIVSVRDLKRCLAKNDTTLCRIPGSPFLICRIWLIHDTPLQDEHLVEWEWFEQGSLQYVVKDVMSSALEELPPGDDLIFCYQDLEELLNPRLLISYIYKIWKQRGQAFCEHVFTCWRSAILSLPREVYPLTATLQRCLAILADLDEAEDLMRAEDPETFSKGYLDRQKVDVETLEQAFHYIDHMDREKAKSDLWKLVQGHPRCCCAVGLRCGLGADLMMALIEKGLPRWCWAGHSDFYQDNLLQHIIAPVAAQPVDWDPQEGGAKARLCRFLAERFSLEELCHQNKDFKNALWYVLQYCENGLFLPDPLWIRVRDVIRERMQAQVREFQGSLLALVELARSVRASSACGIVLMGYLPAFEEQMWQRASIIRGEWLRMGWRFARRGRNAQVSEAVRDKPMIPIGGTPFSVYWMRLSHMDASMAGMELQDDDLVDPEVWECLEQGSLQYMLADVFLLAPEELPCIDDLTFSYENLEELLDPKLLISHAFKLCKHGGQAWCESVFTLWTSALLSLSSNQVNAVENIFSRTLLNRCFSLLQGLDEAEDLMRSADPDFANRIHWSDWYEDFYDKDWPGDHFEDFLHKTFASMTIELVKQKADPQRVEESFRQMNKERLKSDVWKLVQGHSYGCSRLRNDGALRFGLGAELVMALIDKGLPRCCWAGYWGPFKDNLLQHIIAPLAAVPEDWEPEDEAKARLCIFLAERFSLAELCHQATDGNIALGYAELFCQDWRFADPLWIRVRYVIRERMQAQVREFQGNLLELVELARSVRASFGGGMDALESLPAFEEQMWQRAAITRKEWLRMGWKFAQDSTNGQVSEVINADVQ
eukprot:s1934_g4.t1